MQRGFDHHFAGELHAGCAEIQSIDRILGKPAETAVKIAAWIWKNSRPMTESTGLPR